MIFAELHGKLGSDGSRADERLEDLLTSTAFGLLRYLPLQDGILALLGRVRTVQMPPSGARASRDPAWVDLDNAASVEVVFWPTFERYGQPDVLLRFTDIDRNLVGIVLVEAKLYAPKSGTAGPDAGEVADDEAPDPDQLVKYWQGLQQYVRSTPHCPTWLVYLTAHSSPPLGELADALRRLRTMKLGWLSWFDVFDVASACDALPAKDLSALLARKGFRGYKGFTATAAELPLAMGFWEAAPNSDKLAVGASAAKNLIGAAPQWFSSAQQSIALPTGVHFWKQK